MKKRLLSGFLVLMLLAGCGTKQEPSDSEISGGGEPVSLPEIGQIVDGFEAMEIRDFSQINASVVRFVHRKTGAQLYYIANDDIERVFDLTFRTESPDDTGIPHVFEHAILNGSVLCVHG